VPGVDPKDCYGQFWSIIWIVIWSFVFVAYLFVLFYISPTCSGIVS